MEEAAAAREARCAGGGSLCETATSVGTCRAAIGGGAGELRVIPHAEESPATAAKASADTRV